MDGVDTFLLPPIAPDFALMRRDKLEDYAAEVDHRLRAQSTRIASEADDVVALFVALSRARKECVTLTTTEVDLLCALRPRFKSKDSLFDLVWLSKNLTVELKIVDVYICKIRKKIAPLGLHIETIWGQGYAFPDRDRLFKMIEAWRESGCLPDTAPPEGSVAVTRPGRTRSPRISNQLRDRIGSLRKAGVGQAEIAKQTGATPRQVHNAITSLKNRGHHFPALRSK